MVWCRYNFSLETHAVSWMINDRVVEVLRRELELVADCWDPSTTWVGSFPGQ